MQKKRSMKIFLILVFSFLLVSLSEAELGIGLGWPYLCLKYNFLNSISSELRWSTGEGINVFSCRGYWNFKSFDRLKLFTGLEAGYINFDTVGIKGSGWEGSVFIGCEYFVVLQKFSIALDFSPTFISLSSDKYKIDGVELITNLAVYYYFSSR